MRANSRAVAVAVERRGWVREGLGGERLCGGQIPWEVGFQGWWDTGDRGTIQ